MATYLGIKLIIPDKPFALISSFSLFFRIILIELAVHKKLLKEQVVSARLTNSLDDNNGCSIELVTLNKPQCITIQDGVAIGENGLLRTSEWPSLAKGEHSFHTLISVSCTN